MLHESVHVSNYSINYYICQNILLFKVTTYDKKKSFLCKISFIGYSSPKLFKVFVQNSMFLGDLFQNLIFLRQ